MIINVVVTKLFALNEQCGVNKLSSAEIIKILDITRSCPTCGRVHFTDRPCKTVIQGKSRICTKGCKHNGYPLHYAACKHHDEASSCTVSVKRTGATDDAERSIPLIETVHIGDIPIGIQ